VNGETGELEPYIFIKRGKVENIETSTINKIIAYYPLVKEAGELDLPLLPNPFEEINIEDLSEKANGYAYYGKPLGEKYLAFKEGFIEGYKAAQSKQFSLEDMKKAIDLTQQICDRNAHYVQRDRNVNVPMITIDEEEEIIQSISTQKLPKEFIPEYYLMNEGYDKPEDYPYQECKVLKTIINSEGKKMLTGKWVY